MKPGNHLLSKLIFLVLAMFMIQASVIRAQEINLETELILKLPMNGNADDESGKNVPTLPKGPELTNDRYGNPDQAYLFNGISDYIEINNNQALITSMAYTICMWARMDGPSSAMLGSNSLFEQRDASTGEPPPVVLHFNADQDGISRHIVRTSAEIATYKTDTPFPGYGEWHHFVAMVDPDRLMYIFIDGELRTTTRLANEGNIYRNVQYVSIGAHHPESLTTGAFNGAIDEVYVYGRALKICEIEALYSGQLLNER
jgi:hypothetical protein